MLQNANPSWTTVSDIAISYNFHVTVGTGGAFRYFFEFFFAFISAVFVESTGSGEIKRAGYPSPFGNAIQLFSARKKFRFAHIEQNNFPHALENIFLIREHLFFIEIAFKRLVLDPDYFRG